MCLFFLSVIHLGEFADNFYLLNLVKDLCISWISYAKGHILFLGVFQYFWGHEEQGQGRSDPAKGARKAWELLSFERREIRKPASEIAWRQMGWTLVLPQGISCPSLVPSWMTEPLSALTPLQGSCSPSPSSGQGWPSCWALPCCVFMSTLTKSPEVSECALGDPPASSSLHPIY